MKWIRIFIPAWALFVVAGLTAGCGARPITDVDPALVGTWQGECNIATPVVFNPAQLPDDVVQTKTPVSMTMTIAEDASVTGNVGAATIEASVLKRNRGELGRQLNVASDFIIIDGYLAGPIVPGDEESDRKEFTIPFDRVNEHIRGSLMWRQAWRYPYPLCEVDLE